MNNFPKSNNNAHSHTPGFVFSVASEVVLSFLALLLTLADLMVRGAAFLVVKTMRIMFHACCALLLMSAFIVVYLVGMGIHLVLGTGFNTNLS